MKKQEVIKILENKFQEYGILVQSMDEVPGNSLKITLSVRDQPDPGFKERLQVLKKQLQDYFGIELRNEYVSVDRILYWIFLNRTPQTSSRYIDSDNPLLNPLSCGWRGRIPFSKIRLEHFLPAIEEGIRVAKEVHEIIYGNTDEPSFDNTLGHGYDHLVIAPWPSLGYIREVFSVYKNLVRDKEIMKLASVIEDKISDYTGSIMFDRRLYDRNLQVYERNRHLLSDIEKRILEVSISHGKDHGYDLSKPDQERLKELRKRLIQVRLDYDKNTLEAAESELTKVPELPGLPAYSLDNMKDAESGYYSVNLRSNNVSDILAYCTDRVLREKVFKSYALLGFGGKYDNTKNCVSILNLSLEISRLLGYNSVASKVLACDHMLGSVEEVYGFLGSLLDPVREAARKEMKHLNEFIKKVEDKDFVPQPWDYAYYTRLLKKTEFDLDPQVIRKYFSFQKILEGLFWIAGELYDLRYVRIEDAQVYNPDVQVYEVYCGDRYMGMLYVDPFVRPNKVEGAYCTNLVSQGFVDIPPRLNCRPITMIVTNFDKSGEMSFRDVQTLFHEFGHSLMETLSDVEYSSISGNNVYWDYVELASQFMENFAYEPEFLKKYATNDKGDPIPMKYIKAIKDQANFMEGSSILRQLELCYIDMAWWTPTSALDINSLLECKMAVLGTERHAIKKYRLHIPERNYFERGCVSVSFSHIFTGGYKAGYYSYLNSEVLAADAFSAFGPDPIHNRESADRFRKYILSAGNSDDPGVLYTKFKGSKPEVKAFLKQKGIL